MTPEQALSESWQILFGCEFHPESLAAKELLEIIHAQRAEAVAEATKWQPIETAPKDGSTFLAFWPKVFKKPFICWFNFKSQKFESGREECDRNEKPTHWQPLPAPPAQEGEG